MQLMPRYGRLPALSVEVPMADPSVPVLRQRRRLAATVETLDAEQWASIDLLWRPQDLTLHSPFIGSDTLRATTCGRRASRWR